MIRANPPTLQPLVLRLVPNLLLILRSRLLLPLGVPNVFVVVIAVVVAAVVFSRECSLGKVTIVGAWVVGAGEGTGCAAVYDFQVSLAVGGPGEGLDACARPRIGAENGAFFG